MESRKGKKCILYSRVSTEMQVDGYSLEAQTHGLKRYADREEMIVIDTYEDAGKSGKSIEGRPDFKRMLNDISQGLEIDYILVYKLSRFGRNAADILSSLEYVQSYGVNLICIEEGIDSSMTAGRLLISVLSAVAEIERENIIEQTMNGRREKARQGRWNGGFAPYGYKLENGKLFIAEDEAETIRIIFDKFINTDMGYNGVAKYLNLQGIKKKVRQNSPLSEWSAKTIKELIDNPIYCGKLSYGRRTKEKVKGTKNEYRQVRTDNYILVDGEHEAIISIEDWNRAKEKRNTTGIKAPSKIGRDRAHLLTGILKCPVCGSPMYTNKNTWTNKDGKYNERFYYVCSRTRQQRGKSCNYKRQLMKENIEPDVIMAIKLLVTNKEFAKEIKSRIGTQIDTTQIDKEIKNYETNLRQIENNKCRLENEIDSLPEDTKYRDRKLKDMNSRLDNLYNTIYELEDKIKESRAKRKSIEMSAITIDNIYKILLNFDKVYDRLNDDEKKTMIQGFIKEIQVYPKEEQAKHEHPIKSITFNFPVFINGEFVDMISWEKESNVETCCLLSRIK